MKSTLIKICSLVMLLAWSFTASAQCDYPPGQIDINSAGGSSSSLYTTNYVLVDAAGDIVEVATDTFFTGVVAGSYSIYAVNYKNLTAPTGDTLTTGEPWADVVTWAGFTANCASLTPNPGLEIVVGDVVATITASTDPLCNGASDGTATVSGSGGSGGYTYAWSNSESGATATTLEAGITYTVTATDGNGCTGTTTVTLTEPAVLVANETFTDESCEGADDGTATVAPTGGSGTYTYIWSNGGSTASLSGLADGTYGVTISDGTCSTTASVTVGAGATIVANETFTDESCEGADDGTATVAPTGGSGTYTYIWSNGGSTASLSGLADGTYGVTISDGTCSTTASVTVGAGATIVANETFTDESCEGADDGTATVAPTGGSGTYTYIWSNGGSTASLSGLADGTYGVTISDGTCSTTASVTVGAGATIVANETFTDESCEGADDGTATVAPTGGSGTYTYTWSNGGSTASLSGLADGTYGVTISDGTCSTTASVTVGAGATIVANETFTDESCEGADDGTATVAPTGGSGTYTYTWSNGGSTASLSGLADGTYGVTISDGTCSTTASVTVGAGATIVANETFTDESCEGADDGTATVAPTGGSGTYTYTWSNGGSTASLSGLADGTYGVTISDGTCSTTASVTVGAGATIVANETFTDESCEGADDGTATVAPTGGSGTYTYTWSNGGSTASLSGLADGTYGVTISDGTCSTTASVTVGAGATIVANETFTDESCEGADDGTATVAPTGGSGTYTYTWSNGGSTASLSGLADGTYGVTISDGTCSTTASVTVGAGATIVANETFTDESCEGADDGTATVAPTGGSGTYTYTWSNGGSTASLSGLADGTYGVTISDGTCSTTASVTVGAGATIVANETFTDESCEGADDGTATVAPTGGSGTYTYTWSNGGSTASLSGLADGTYGVTISDGTCSTTASVTVGAGATIVANETFTDESCEGADDGTATVAPTGGSGTYTYTWSNGGSTASLSGLADGTYGVTISDGTCSTTASVTVGAGATIVANETFTDESCEGADDGTATVAPTGGSGTYTYIWSNGGSTASLSGLADGTYGVTISDGTCSTTASVTVGAGATIVANETFTDESCEGADDGTATVAPTGGSGTYTYIWSNGGSTASLSGLADGTYGVTISDGTCSTTASVTVGAGATIVANETFTDESCEGADDGTATVAPTGGSGTYTYIWSNGGSTASLSGLADGTYGVTISDGTCSTTASVTVGAGATIVANETFTDESCEGADDGTATVAPTGGSGTYTYTWSNGGSTASLSGLADGTYGVTISDGTCSTTASVTVGAGATIVANETFTDESCEGADDGTATVAPTGGSGTYTYTWSNGGSTASLSGLADGTYGVTISDGTCSTTASVTVGAGATIVANETFTDESCEGADDGTATVAPTGGSGTYTYTWSNGGSTASLSGLADGTYGVTISDGTCSTTASVTVGAGATIVANETFTDESCEGADDGTATVAPTGGSGTYTYIWSNGGSTASLSGLADGTYGVTISDGTCSTTASVTVGAGATIVANETFTDESCEGADDGTATVAPTGGSGTYTYIWSNGGSTASLSGLADGTYGVTISDGTCSTTASVTVGAGATIVANETFTDESCEGADDGTATVAPTGGSGTYTYTWSNGGSTASLSGLADGTYGVTISDGTCSTTASVTVGAGATIVANETFTDESCEGADDGTATVAPTGGSGTYTYTWSNGGSTASLSGLADGTYGVTISDGTCSTTASVTVGAGATIVANETFTDESCEGADDGTATVAPTGGSGTYTYTWSNGGSTASLSGLADGTYGVTISDGTCSTTASVTVGAGAPVIADAPSPITNCGPYTIVAGDMPTNGTLYYGPGGTGGLVNVDDVISSTTTLYVYASVSTCTDENSFNITISSPVTAAAGGDQNVCGDDAVTLAATGSGTWTGGAGLFTPGLVFYDMGPGASFGPDIELVWNNGTNTFTRSNFVNGSDLADTMNVWDPTGAWTFDVGLGRLSTASSGTLFGDLICNNTAIVFSKTFPLKSNGSSAGSTYTPDPSEVGSSVTLTWTVSGGACPDDSDTMVATFGATPLAEAGTSVSACDDLVTIDLTAYISGFSATNGTGAWSVAPVDGSIAGTTYTPSATAQSGGLVTITYTVTGTGDCSSETDIDTVDLELAVCCNAEAPSISKTP